MLKIQKINNSVTVIKALDPELRIFDIVMETKFGTSYNSYLIDGGDELALVDTAKEHYFEEYFQNLQKLCDIKKIKYLIVNHTEPDHSGEIHNLLERMPWLEVVGTSTALSFLKDISNKVFKARDVKHGEKIKVGNKTLSFVVAPNLHWPDSMFTLLEEERTLFTCDVFGSHYCTSNIYNNEVENDLDYKESFKYYYDVIFGPFKPFVKSGIQKINDLNMPFSEVCPSHGPVIKGEDFFWFKEQYLKWSDEIEVNTNKITIAYVSAYGYTKTMAKEMKTIIEGELFEVSMIDLVTTPVEVAEHEIKTSLAFLIGSPTLNSDTLPSIWDLLLRLNKYNVGGKFCAAFGAFGWSGEAVRNIESRLSQIGCEVFRPGLRIKFNPNDEIKLEKIKNFGKAFAKKSRKLLECSPDSDWCQIKTGLWKCLVCGEIYEGDFPPETCPACGAPSDQFVTVSNDNISFKSESEETIIIIGSGIAGVSAAESIRKRNQKARIEIISEETQLPYFRILLSKKLMQESGIDLIKKKSWFDENRIKLSLGKKILKILPIEKTILFCDSTFVNFDKLIIATGSRPNKLNIQGNDKEGIFYLRNKKDFDEINSFAKKESVKKVIIVGGGVLGIEMASNLKNFGKEVEVVEFAPRIMFKQLDEEGSNYFQKVLISSGIKHRCSESVQEILGNGTNYSQVCGVKLKNSKEEINCQMIIFATGVIPNKELIEGSPVKTNRGIIVDKTMRTNIDYIFAVGDVCEFEGKNICLWASSMKQGEIAGANAIGDNLEYTSKLFPVSFNELNCKIFSIGDLALNFQKEEYQILELSDTKNGIYKKFYFYDNMFVGGILIGDTSKAVQVQRAILNSSTIQHFLDAHFLDES